MDETTISAEGASVVIASIRLPRRAGKAEISPLPISLVPIMRSTMFGLNVDKSGVRPAGRTTPKTPEIVKPPWPSWCPGKDLLAIVVGPFVGAPM